MKKIRKYQSGVSLVEIMVSILVMAIGLLGLASLQINAMKYQQSSGQRSEASDMAYDLSERMRANAGASASYARDSDYAAGSVQTPDDIKECPVNTQVCNAADVARNDLSEWTRTLRRKLVGGNGYVVSVPGTSVPTFDITIMWKEQGLEAKDTNCPQDKAPIGVRCFTYRVTP